MIERVSAAYAARPYDERAWAASGHGASSDATAPTRFDAVLASVLAASFAPPLQATRPGNRPAPGRVIRG